MEARRTPRCAESSRCLAENPDFSAIAVSDCLTGQIRQCVLEQRGASTYFKDIGTVEVVIQGLTATRKTSRLERVGLNPRQSATIKFVAKKTGPFEFACHISGHYEAGMKGTLTVK